MESIQSEKYLLKRREAANFLSVSVATLDRYAKRNDFPKAVKFGSSIRYVKSELEQFISTQRAN